MLAYGGLRAFGNVDKEHGGKLEFFTLLRDTIDELAREARQGERYIAVGADEMARIARQGEEEWSREKEGLLDARHGRRVSIER